VSAAAATKTAIGAPKNLTWNKVWDAEKQELVAKNGAVSWQFTKPFAKGENGIYSLTLYRDGGRVYSQGYGFDAGEVNGTRYYSCDFRHALEESGTYHFEMRIIAQNSSQKDSKTVASRSWTYEMPDTKVAAPTNVGWNWPDAAWRGEGDFQVDMYYSPTKVTEADDIEQMRPLSFQTSVQGNSTGYGLGGGMAGYYRYRVRTLASDINENTHSDWVLSDIYYLPLETPEVKVTRTSSGNPKISWEMLAEPCNVEVYRSTSEKGSYTKIKTVKYNADISPEKNVYSYTDKDVVRGKTYYYKVRAVSFAGVKSSYSTPIAFCVKLARPTVKAANVLKSGKVKLTWNKVTGAKGYEVYRATAKDGEYMLMKTVTGTTYTNTSAEAGKRYYYKVKAIGSSTGVSSNFSEVVYRMCDLGRPEVSVKLNNKGKPRLSWDAVNGAVEYKIYRATSKSGTYTLLKTTTNTYFANTGAKAGKTYYYKVKAIHADTNANSAYSTVVNIKSR